MSILKFPENFKWGSATSSHQIEGNNHNDWSEWERSEKRVQSLKERGQEPGDFMSGRASDSYNRYEEDFDIAKELNHNVHRFSIEWSRIEPEEGKFNEAEMQHYIKVVKALKERGMEPMITLWHFTSPVWFMKKGGFINVNSPQIFTKYVEYVVKNLRDEVGLWITFNEPTTVYSGFSYLRGLWPPEYKSILKWRRVNRNIIKAHIESYKAIKRIYDSPINFDNKNDQKHNKSTKGLEPAPMSHNVGVGISESNTYAVVGKKFYERIVGKIYDYYRNKYLWTKAFPYYDFMGLNYYHIDRRTPGSYATLPRQDWWMEEMNWEIYPRGIYYVLKNIKKFKRPIYITENGTADSKDLVREKFIKEHLKFVHQAIDEGVDVRGYFYWSLLDNFEWALGFSPRFGLVAVDYDTMKRSIRSSALEYAKICKDNQLLID